MTTQSREPKRLFLQTAEGVLSHGLIEQDIIHYNLNGDGRSPSRTQHHLDRDKLKACGPLPYSTWTNMRLCKLDPRFAKWRPMPYSERKMAIDHLIAMSNN